jgi:hypothetical protein
MPWPFSRKKKSSPHPSSYFASTEPQLSYWLYFKAESDARAAADRLRGLDLEAEAGTSASDPNEWLVIANCAIPEDSDVASRITQSVRAVATSLGGDFDGWEAGPIAHDEGLQEKLKSWDQAGVFG